MKKPIVIVFIVILAIHLLALALFLMYQKDDEPVKEPDKKEIIPEPEIDPGSIGKKINLSKNPETGKMPKLIPENKVLSSEKSSPGFYVQKEFPSFEFKGAVSGDLSAVSLTKEGLKIFLRLYEEKKQSKFKHPVLHRQCTYQESFEIQARLLAKFLMAETEQYPPLILK